MTLTLASPRAGWDPSVLAVHPWPDPVLDRDGHDPRSAYAERFWLSSIGPSALLLLRRVANELDHRPSGFELDLGDVARSLGLGTRGGGRAPLVRTVLRLCQFRLANLEDHGALLLVRRRLPGLNRYQVGRLPPPLQEAHDAWIEEEATERDQELRNRARHLALS